VCVLVHACAVCVCVSIRSQRRLCRLHLCTPPHSRVADRLLRVPIQTDWNTRVHPVFRVLHPRSLLKPHSRIAFSPWIYAHQFCLQRPSSFISVMTLSGSHLCFCSTTSLTQVNASQLNELHEQLTDEQRHELAEAEKQRVLQQKWAIYYCFYWVETTGKCACAENKFKRRSISKRITSFARTPNNSILAIRFR
jgi:hypothetical protein